MIPFSVADFFEASNGFGQWRNLTRFAGEAALWITTVLTHPFRIAMAKDRNAPTITKQTIQRMFDSGTVPLGVSAIAAALFIVGMYIMT